MTINRLIQFTLGVDKTKGLRPSLRVADPGIVEPLYELPVENIRTGDIPVQTGVFDAHMDVALVNDGPPTFMLKS
ncbi:MAG TPA: hypothetical protein EYP91_18585 [Gammaproteobacteria bacterium]|nr:hypothetical protein [Gammaproteobacteria bacterium]